MQGIRQVDMQEWTEVEQMSRTQDPNRGKQRGAQHGTRQQSKDKEWRSKAE